MTSALAQELLEEAGYIFGACKRTLDSETVQGRTCEAKEGTLYHHTEMRNLASIRESGSLRPGGPPFGDGTVNFSSNPNFHRFGSLRLVVNKDKVDTEPMCYTSGAEEKRRMQVRERYEGKLREQGQFVSPNRIENLYLGAESWQHWKNECKHSSRQAVPLRNAVKAVEYWVPWKPSEFGTIAGSNVVPCHAMWGAWETGRSPGTNEAAVRKEIADAKALANELAVPFRVRSCYPFVTLEGYQAARLDEENLRRLEDGRELIVKNYFPDDWPKECTCPSEGIPEPEVPT